MKKHLRSLILCFALLLCVLPLATACDSADDPSDTSSVAEDVSADDSSAAAEDDYADKQIAKHPSLDRKYYVLYRQLTAPDASAGTVGVSLTLYAEDGTELDAVNIQFSNGGVDAVTADVARLTWYDTYVEILMNDAAGTVYTLRDNRG